MRFKALSLLALLALSAGQALPWSNHSFAAYRAFDAMPEVARAAPVVVEPLEVFLKDQESAIERLLASQDPWAKANLEVYPALPAALAFRANPA
ncbi:MAG: hypothetical protein RIS90_1095, partial [Pseudomonadota bacterium]